VSVYSKAVQHKPQVRVIMTHRVYGK